MIIYDEADELFIQDETLNCFEEALKHFKKVKIQP
jgi:hypothetical protein